MRGADARLLAHEVAAGIEAAAAAESTTAVAKHSVATAAAAASRPAEHHDARTARAAGATHGAEQVLGRKVALVDVVGHAEQREPRPSTHHGGVGARLVEVLVAVSAVHLAELR